MKDVTYQYMSRETMEQEKKSQKENESYTESGET